jgi:hypothetical protein
MTTLEAILIVAFLAVAGGALWMYRRLLALGAEVGRLTREQRALQARLDNVTSVASVASGAAPSTDSSGASQLVGLAGMAAQLQQAADELADAAADREGRLQELLAAADRRIVDLAAAGPAPRPAQGASGADAPAAGYDEVWRLAAEGFAPAEIAQRTHRGREEVRLLLQVGQPGQSPGQSKEG